MSDLDQLTKQKNEFDALVRLAKSYDAMPPIVDDDYPEYRHYYERELHAFLLACCENGRISADSKTWRQK